MQAGSWFCFALAVVTASIPFSEQSACSKDLNGDSCTRSRPPAGLTNTDSNCYLNSLISSLNALPDFRYMVYSNFQRAPILLALGMMFTKLSSSKAAVNPLPDIMRAFEKQDVKWDFEDFQCAHEMFSTILGAIPSEVLGSCVGVGLRENLLTADNSSKENYSITTSSTQFQNNDIINLYMPQKDIAKRCNLNLQDMIFGQGQESSERELRLKIEDHSDFFTRQGWSSAEKTVKVFVRPEYQNPSRIVPIYVNRRVHRGECNEMKASTVKITVPSKIRFDTSEATHELMSFVCYKDGHYYAYARIAGRAPRTGKSGEPITYWYLLNDETVREIVSTEREFIKDQAKCATLFFYAKTECSEPEPDVLPFLVRVASLEKLIEKLAVVLPKFVDKVSGLDSALVRNGKASARPGDDLERMAVDPYRNVVPNLHKVGEQGCVKTDSPPMHYAEVYEQNSSFQHENPISTAGGSREPHTLQGKAATGSDDTVPAESSLNVVSENAKEATKPRRKRLGDPDVVTVFTLP